MFSRLFQFTLSVVVIGVMATPVGHATEAFSGAEDLRGWCSSMDNDDVHWGLCVGSVAAAHDTIMTYQSFDDMRKIVCVNPTITRGDLVITVMEFMETHPEYMDLSLGDVVFSALREAYPCN
ncbi:MAG: Rap1a/Tai family immunity protein [Magnetovibrio sp.]|nr:Rap1a/Tai family immunity protein [Magnetovibrio sp.]